MAGVDRERAALVAEHRDGWIRRLLDLSPRNNLLYFRDLETDTLDLSDAGHDEIEQLLAGAVVPLFDLSPAGDENTIVASVRQIRRRALTNLEEKGLETLFLTLGLASWAVDGAGRPPAAPVLLVPVEVGTRGRDAHSAAIRRAGDIVLNPVLLYVLEADFGCRIDADELLQITVEPHGNESFDPAATFTRLQLAAKNVKDFQIAERAILGNFAYHYVAMVKDLRERPAELAAHEMIAAIAGFAPARESVRAMRADVDPQTLDDLAPEQELLVLDADAGQQRILRASSRLQSGVIQGPPGAGKSQTIANLIAQLAAQGRRILFVAEKRAALEVVLQRLDEVGLGHLVMDLHGADGSQHELIDRLADSLAIVEEPSPAGGGKIYRRLAECRQGLNEHIKRMHTPLAPAGLTVYDMQGRLLHLPAESKTALRWRGPALRTWNRQNAEAALALLSEASGMAGLVLRNDPSPWTGALLSDEASAQEAVGLARRLAGSASGGWPALRSAVAKVAVAGGGLGRMTLEQITEHLLLCDDVAGTLQKYKGDIYEQNLSVLRAALRPSINGPISAGWAWRTNASYRDARQTLNGLRAAGNAPTWRLYNEATAAEDQARRWKAAGLGWPPAITAEAVDDARSRLRAFRFDLEALARFLDKPEITRLRLAALQSLLDGLARDNVTPFKIPRLLELEAQLDRQGLGSLVEELRGRALAPELWPAMFEYAWLASCLDLALTADRTLATFNGQMHEQLAEEFRQLDALRIRLAAGRVRSAHAQRAVAARNAHPEQDYVLRREIRKQAGGSVRGLFKEAADLMTRLRPCWMVSPLSVSQLLPVDRPYFDVVIFDEASQVSIEHAIPAILRGTHVIVAGDPQQLPPTPFAADGADEREEATSSPAAGSESILDVLSSFLEPWCLDWHYRSRDESLIGFSNRYIYNGRLVTFPSPGGPPAVKHILVPQASGDGEKDATAPQAVRRVVDLVLEHAAARPAESLGVVTLDLKHAQDIQSALDDALAEKQELDDFFDEDRAERFFVKSVEHVQGDERDAIILSIDAGKDGTGGLRDSPEANPLLQQGGERWLNVAITRARRRMTVVSCFDDRDIDLSRSRGVIHHAPRGLELLRLYLNYADKEGRSADDRAPGSQLLSPFAEDVASALTARGIGVVAQWSAGPQPIELAVQHRERPERLVLAIECDGEAYRSALTTRDRERLREQQLEALGWRFHRIWSTEWFLRREQEITRAVEAYTQAMAHAERIDASGMNSSAGGPLSIAGPAGLRSPSQTGISGFRDARPMIPRRHSVMEYDRLELMALVSWIQSDGYFRTDDELIDEIRREIGSFPRGGQIESGLRRIIRSVQSNEDAG